MADEKRPEPRKQEPPPGQAAPGEISSPRIGSSTVEAALKALGASSSLGAIESAIKTIDAAAGVRTIDNVIGIIGSRPLESYILPTELAGTTSLLFKSDRETALEQEIAKLKNQISGQQRALEKESREGEARRATVEQLTATVAQLQEKERLSFVLKRIHTDARDVFLGSPEFQAEFLKNKQSAAFVLAVDVRRSTELMLKSRKPEMFAEFITKLSNGLREIVLQHHGVFDKFTGDGILAFFPDFYTGSDAGFYALAAANACHRLFSEHYRKSYGSFYSILSLKEVGLGIGIDYGDVSLVLVGDELAIVGNPVVYACRMATAPAGQTLANQPAYEKLSARFSRHCVLRDAELEMKHEGLHVAYEVHLNNQPYEPEQPSWLKYRKVAEPQAQ
jgi:class 3 adenylate cyclase